MTNRSVVRWVLAICVAVLLAACSNQPQEASYSIKMTGQALFEPATLVIEPGTTVVWKNYGNIVHTVTSDPQLSSVDGNIRTLQSNATENWSSGDIYPGQSWRHTFTTPGEYLFFCRFHEQENMVGLIRVVEKASEEE